MYFDALTLSAVADELRRTIVGGRIQRVLLPTPLSIGLEVYNAGTRYQLFATADPRAARVHLLGAKPTRGSDRDTPLSLLLRKYVRNGFVATIEQPPLERILVLSIIKHPAPRKEDPDDVDEELRADLVLELMGNRANILLVDDNNLILDAIKRVPAGAKRTIMPRDPYIAPPRPARLDPRTATGNGIRSSMAGAERDPAKAIVGAYGGVSPQQAREAIARAIGSAAREPDAEGPDRPEPAFDAIADALRGLWTAPFEPSLAYQDEQVLAFAPYRMQQHAASRPVDSISEALEIYYAGVVQVTSHAQRREALLRRLDEVRERARRQADSLSRELERASALERLRWEGEMIFGWLHEIVPGQTELTVEGKTIMLDPQRTAVENARARFREYDKAKSAVAGVPERLASAENELRYIDETMTMLELAEGYEAIAAIEREATEGGMLKAPGGKAPRGPRSQPLRVTSSDGIPIWVGRSAGQNDEVTFRVARSDDLWLHVREQPGAHVVIRADVPVPDRTLEQAAGLAAYYSRARASTTVDVVVTRRRNVRKIAGGPPGLVSYQNERSLRVAPLSPEDVGSL